MRWGLAMVAAALLAQPVAAEDAAGEGAALYRQACAGCHGRDGRDRAQGRARPVAGLEAQEVREYLLSTRQIEGRPSASARLKAALSDDEVAALAAYLSGLEAR